MTPPSTQVSAIYSGWAEARTAAPLGFDQLPWSAVAARLAADNAALKEEQAALRQGLEEHQVGGKWDGGREGEEVGGEREQGREGGAGGGWVEQQVGVVP
jgi:hypothetical protein